MFSCMAFNDFSLAVLFNKLIQIRAEKYCSYNYNQWLQLAMQYQYGLS